MRAEIKKSTTWKTTPQNYWYWHKTEDYKSPKHFINFVRHSFTLLGNSSVIFTNKIQTTKRIQNEYTNQNNNKQKIFVLSMFYFYSIIPLNLNINILQLCVQNDEWNEQKKIKKVKKRSSDKCAI